MDARALLARKKLERKKAAAAKPKINSLFAEYDSLGKLKCKICSVNIKHESLWNSHVASKLYIHHYNYNYYTYFIFFLFIIK